MNVDMKLYAYMKLVYESMTKISKNEGRRKFFDQKFDQNGISKFDMLIRCSIKNHEKMILS